MGISKERLTLVRKYAIVVSGLIPSALFPERKESMTFEEQIQEVENTIQDFWADAVFWLLAITAPLTAITAGVYYYKEKISLAELVVCFMIAIAMIVFSRKFSNFVYFIGTSQVEPLEVEDDMD